MKVVSNELKSALKQPTTQRKGRILVKGNYYDVYNVEYYADAYNEGNVIGNAIASQLNFELPYIEKFDTFKYFDGVWTGNEYEYIDMGTFTVFDEQDEDEFTKKITAFDNLIKFNAPFEDVGGYPKTLFEELKNICNQAGIELNNTNIPNGSFKVENNQFVNEENLKTVLKAICQISGTYAVIKNDKLNLQLYNETINETTGTNEINLKNAKEGNALAYNIIGKSEQKTRSGKNVLKNILTSQTINGVTITKYDDGSFLLNGTSTTEFYPTLTNNFTIEADTYTLSSGEAEMSNEKIKLALRQTHQNILIGQILSGTSITVNNTYTDEVFIFMTIRNGQTFNNMLIKPMLERGPVQTEYEAYGASPSPDYPSEIKTVKGIRNLANINEIAIGKQWEGSANVNRASILFIEVEATKQYTLKGNISVSSNLTTLRVVFSNSNKEYISIANEGTFKAPTTAKYASIEIISSVAITNEMLKNIWISLVQGNNAPNVPYGSWLKIKTANDNQENEVLIDMNIYDEEGNVTDYHELASIKDTKDNLEVVSGALTKRIGKVVLDETINFNVAGEGGTGYYAYYLTLDDIGVKLPSGANIPCYCTHFKQSNYGSNKTEECFMIGYASSSGNHTILLVFKDITTTTELKTWLSENPVTIYYELVEEETIQLTPTNIPLFEGVNNVTLLEDLDTETSIIYKNKISEALNKSQHEPVSWKRTTYGINQVVLGMKDVEGEYVLREDLEDIAKNGVHKLVINDNPFAYTEDKRAELIDELFNQVKGFGYVPFEMNGEWLSYLDVGDTITLDGVETVLLRINGKSPKALESTISAPAIIDSSIEYIDNTDSIENQLKRTEIIVDKQNQKIESLTSKVVDISNTISKIGSVTLENAHEGQLYYLSIKGNISLLFPSSQEGLYGYPLTPSENLVPNETLVPSTPIHKDNKILYPSNELFSRSNILLIDDKEYKLDIDFLNYLNNIDCDEFIYEDGKCKIIRRLGVDENGELYKLENEVIELKEDITLNVKSDSIIKMKSFENAIFKVTYLLENEYTNYFATNVEVESSIEQTANTINLKVDQKLDGEEFTGANIMLQINKDESLAQINADKIDLSGKEINLTSDDITINSDDFKVTKNGEIEAKAGTIGGWNIDKTSLWGSIVPPKDYEESDLTRMQQIMLGNITPTSSDYEFYDFNKDGLINSYDLLICRKLIIYDLKKSNPGKLIFDISDWTTPIKIINSYGEELVTFGPGGVYTKEID